MPSRECWFKSLPGAGDCEGARVKCHLVRTQTLKREAGAAAVRDPRSWVWGCGGPTGIGGHHGRFQPDGWQRIDRHRLPPEFEEFMEEVELGWLVDRTYGPRSFDRGEDRHTVTVDAAAAHAGTMHRDPLTGLYL